MRRLLRPGLLHEHVPPQNMPHVQRLAKQDPVDGNAVSRSHEAYRKATEIVANLVTFLQDDKHLSPCRHGKVLRRAGWIDNKHTVAGGQPLPLQQTYPTSISFSLSFPLCGVCREGGAP